MRPTDRSDEVRQRHKSLDGGWRGHSEWIAVVIRLQKNASSYTCLYLSPKNSAGSLLTLMAVIVNIR